MELSQIISHIRCDDYSLKQRVSCKDKDVWDIVEVLVSCCEVDDLTVSENHLLLS